MNETYTEYLGGGFRLFPSVAPNELPNRLILFPPPLSFSLGRPESILFLPRLCLEVLILSLSFSSDGDVGDSPVESFEVLFASFPVTAESCDLPNSRLRILLPLCTTSLSLR